jgi:PAS domain S-box-containing protein
VPDVTVVDDAPDMDQRPPAHGAEPARARVSAVEAERLARIIEIQQAIATTSLDFEQVIETVLSGAQALTGADGVGVVMRDGADFPLRGATSTGPARAGVVTRNDEPSLIGECLRSGRVLRCDDTEIDERVNRATSRASGTRSILYMPVHDGREAIGVVAMLSGRPAAFTERDEQSLTLISGLLSAAIVRAASFETNQRLLAERTAALAALRESEERYRSVTEQIREVLFETDPDGRVTFLSAAWTLITGIAVSEALGADLLDLVIAEDRQATLDALRPLIRGERDQCSQAVRYRTRDGGLRWLELRARLRTDASGRVLGTAGTLNDVTERRRLEQQLLQAQKLEAIGQLAAGVAHEINTPTQYVGDNVRFAEGAFGDVLRMQAALRAVADSCRHDPRHAPAVAAADSLARELDVEFLAEELPSALAQALEGIERIAEIVRGVKAFSDSGAGGLTPTDLNHQLESAITVSRNEWKHAAEVVRDLDPSLPPVYCRVAEVNQVLLNIVVNAAQAIAEVRREGGVREKGEIRVASRRDGGWVEVRISDTGGGVPPAVRSRIFDPFFTTKPLGKGTGQGLAVAHGIVEQHGGTITFETEVGAGTMFIVRLPIAPRVGKDAA